MQIDNGRRSRRLLRVVADDLSAPVVSNGGGGGGGGGGGDGQWWWSNGSLTMGAADLEGLYNSDLYLNVATDGGGGGGASGSGRSLRGRIVLQGLDESHGGALSPVLLSGGAGTDAAGVGWLHVDSTCAASYQVRVAGMDPNAESTLLLRDFPMVGLRSPHAMMPGRERRLRTFRGAGAAGGRITQACKILQSCSQDSQDPYVVCFPFPSPSGSQADAGSSGRRRRGPGGRAGRGQDSGQDHKRQSPVAWT